MEQRNNKRSETMDRTDREPALDDMLTDPMTQAMMASDGVAADEVKHLLAEACQRYDAARSGFRRR
jgi:hypothetical protein